MTARPGRRPGNSGTREAILEAARTQFADRGYDRTSLRGIAQQADVDPSLVIHFFGSKQALFLTVVELPFDLADVLPTVLAGEPDRAGERLARFVVTTLDSEDARRPLIGLIRSAASEPEAARAVRRLVAQRTVGPLAERLGADDAQTRAALISAQIVGLAMARHIVAIEPLASLDPDHLVTYLAPTFQRLLAEPLDAPD